MFPIEIQAWGVFRTRQGQMEVHPYIPGWVLPLFAILLAVCLLGGGIGISAWDRNQTKASGIASTQIAEIPKTLTVEFKNK